jgi:predicted nucleic acid-binding protein
MVKGTQTACIDSCVVISLLKEGKDRQNKHDIAILKGLLADIHSGKIHIIFPTLLRTELLECHLGQKLIDQFNEWTALTNFDEVPVNSKVSKLASEIRSFYVQRNQKHGDVPKLALADCIFIATAIENDCPLLYTYDGDRLPPSKPRQLLSLKSPIAGKYPLHIQKPDTFQLGM